MTPQAVLTDLLIRLEASRGRTIYVDRRLLNSWPEESVAALKAAGLLVRARPASHLECPGCERHCDKSVELFPAEEATLSRAYIYCDEPEDMGRIDVDLTELEQWRVSIDVTPTAMAQALGVPLLPVSGAKPSRHSRRDDEIRSKYDELAQASKRNYVKEIQRTVPGAESLSPRRIRDIVKGR